jgi:hypothetical protein
MSESECNVCICSDADGHDGSIDSHEIITCDRAHRCSECGIKVPAGSPIEEATWYGDDDPDEWEIDENDEPIEPERKEPIYTCVVCAEIANAFYCEGDGRIFGGDLWDAMAEGEIYAGLNSACFDRLTTPEAKAELRRRWMQWKGLL